MSDSSGSWDTSDDEDSTSSSSSSTTTSEESSSTTSEEEDDDDSSSEEEETSSPSESSTDDQEDEARMMANVNRAFGGTLSVNARIQRTASVNPARPVDIIAALDQGIREMYERGNHAPLTAETLGRLNRVQERPAEPSNEQHKIKRRRVRFDA